MATTNATTSWQDILQKNLLDTGVIESALIVGHDAGVWASKNCPSLPQQDVSSLLQAFKDQNSFQDIKWIQNYYIPIMKTERSLYAKSDQNVLIAVKTKQAFLIGWADTKSKTFVDGQCSVAVEKLADYLISQNF